MRYFQILVGISIIVLGTVATLFFREAYIGKTGGEAVTFSIEDGDTAAAIALHLTEAQVISDGSQYLLYGNLDRSVFRAKAGTYQIAKGDSFRHLAKQFAIGPIRQEVSIRVIEGWTVDTIVDLLAKDYTIDTSSTIAIAGRSADGQGFSNALREDYPFLAVLPKSRSLEGYLFPDTYHVWADELPEGLIYKQLNEFNRRFGSELPSASVAPLKTLDDVIILASIVEKEVARPEDRKIVAGIFLNRLKHGMRLQSDATLNYVTNSGRARSTATDLTIDSPYNTYQHDGLPPSPIGNPGADAIEAVLSPATTKYHYFLTTDKGETLYASTFEEHKKNRARAGF